MNKKVLSVAVAAALGIPAVASAEVTLYGVVHTSVDYLNNGGVGVNQGLHVASNASRIGFKGTEDLGNGLSAIFQYEWGVNATESGGTGSPLTNTRDSFVGLSHKDAGTVIFGVHDTPFKMVGRKVDLFSDRIGDSRSLTNPGGLGTNNWDLRPGNVIAYISPNFNGFSGIVAYVARDGSPNATYYASTPFTNDTFALKNAWSLSGTYEMGGFWGSLAYEKHKFNGRPYALAGYKDSESAWRVAGGGDLMGFKFGLMYQSMKDQGGNTDADDHVWGLSAAYTIMGATTIKAQFFDRNHFLGKGAIDDGAKLWAIGVDQLLSKRTTVYAVYAATSNDTFGSFTATGSHGATSVPALGNDPHGFSVGIIHKF